MSVRLFTLLCVCLLMTGFHPIANAHTVPQATNCSSKNDYWDLMFEALNDEDYPSTLEYANCLYELNPDDPVVHLVLSFVYLQLEAYQKSIEFGEMAIASGELAERPSRFAHTILAVAYRYMGNYDLCIASGEIGLEVDVILIEALDALIFCYQETGQFEQSAELANQYTTLMFLPFADYADAYFYRAYAQYQLGNFEVAYQDIRDAIHRHGATLATDFELQARILLGLGEPYLAYASAERARLLDATLPMDDLYIQIWDALDVATPDSLNKLFTQDSQDLYAQQTISLDSLNSADYETALTQFGAMRDMKWGQYAQQYINAVLAYVSLLNNDFTERVQYSNAFADSANLRGVVRFTELPTEPITISTGFWTGGAYRFMVRPNQVYTFTVEAVDATRFVDPYIVILSGATQLAVEGFGDDTDLDGRVEYVFRGSPGQYIIFVGGFGMAFGDIQLSYTETR
ncbi:MAG: hypothetical protein MUE54_09730 [Anaerolineae bacterium]|nr:hypothetical protein [Anaerolineae bacterium]